MLSVVSNTIPIISLLKLGRFELLRRLYCEIIIPKEVYREIEKGKDKGYYSDLSILERIHIQRNSR